VMMAENSTRSRRDYYDHFVTWSRSTTSWNERLRWCYLLLL